LDKVRLSNGSGCTETVFSTQAIALQVLSSLTHSVHFTDSSLHNASNVSDILLKGDRTCISQSWGMGQERRDTWHMHEHKGLGEHQGKDKDRPDCAK